MKAKTARKSAARPKSPLANAVYYAVVSLACLVGLLAYNAGASLEGTLLRIMATLLACTMVGYLANVFLFLSAGKPEQAATVPTGARPSLAVDLVVGDDAAAGRA